MSVCKIKTIVGNWLMNGELETCLLKLAPATMQEMETDSTRPINMKLLKELLTIEQGETKSLLERRASGHPILVLAPELAYGSTDYDEISQLITAYPKKIIFISGFGFTSGEVLNQLSHLQKIDSVWDGELNNDGKYNCGWIWVKGNDNNVKCYVFLKNYSEQTHEISIPNLETGENILRFEMDDLILFPLICSDLISNQPNNPREAIKSSLLSSYSVNKKIVITGSLFAEKSHSNWWKGPIGDLLNNDYDIRMLLCNCYVPEPIKEETSDMWRCLSGAYQKLTAGSKPPEVSLPYVRYVREREFCGFVLRCSDTGCAFGAIRWTNDPASGKYVWAPSFRYIFHNEKLQQHDGKYAADELYRFIRRFKGTIYDSAEYSAATRTLANSSIEKILRELSPTSSSHLRRYAEQLFTKCLHGVQHNKEKVEIEKLHDENTVLDCALTTLLLINDVLNSKLLPEGKGIEHGQLLLEDSEQEILVWNSKRYPGKRVYDLIASGIVKDGGSARPLTIIGKGNGNGTEPASGRIRSTRLDDTSAPTPKPDEIDVSDSRDRVVYWRQLGEIGDIFASENTVETIVQNVQVRIRLEGAHA